MPDPNTATIAGQGQGAAAGGAGEPAPKPVEAGAVKQSERETYLEAELKKLISERDTANAKARAAENASLAETQKYKELWEKNSPELETLRAFKTDHDARLKAQVIEAEKSLSADEKVEYDKFISKLPEGDRLEWIRNREKARAENKPSSSSPGAGNRPTAGEKTITAARFEGMSPRERAEFFAAGGTLSG